MTEAEEPAEALHLKETEPESQRDDQGTSLKRKALEPAQALKSRLLIDADEESKEEPAYEDPDANFIAEQIHKIEATKRCRLDEVFRQEKSLSRERLKCILYEKLAQLENEDEIIFAEFKKDQRSRLDEIYSP